MWFFFFFFQPSQMNNTTSDWPALSLDENQRMSSVETHLADRLELLVVFVIAGQQEAPVGARPLAFSQVGANHTQVHRVAHPLQIILLQLGGTASVHHNVRSGKFFCSMHYIVFRKSLLPLEKAHTHLQPIMRTLCNFIGCVPLQGLHHEALAGVCTTHTHTYTLMH